jgi:DNA-binding GntR family transcriptional regulator
MEILGVTESAARLLRQEIIMGKISPGAKLNEIELSNRYGISRPPLREAFRKLEYENLVENVPRIGTFVTGISKEDCGQVYFTRRMLEGAAIDAIAQNKNRNISAIHKFMDGGLPAAVPRPADLPAILTYYNELAGFHWKLVEASANRWLVHCYRSIEATLARYQIIYVAIPGTWQPSVKCHREILELMEDEKYQEAKERLDAHILDTYHLLIDNMQNHCPAADP